MAADGERRSEERRQEDRRSGNDRRESNDPPPGKVERRKLGDARKQPIAEVELSDEEWNTLFGHEEKPE